MNSQTNQYDLSFTELIIQNLDFNTKNWYTVQGGMSNLIKACANLVGNKNIHLNSPVCSIYERDDSSIELGISDSNSDTHSTHVFDKAILAIPTAAICAIRERTRWSFMKEQSFRGSWFEPLYKIGLRFRTHFWEQIPDPCFGGQR